MTRAGADDADGARGVTRADADADPVASRRYRFLKTVLMGLVVVMLLGAFFTPPDPLTQLFVIVPGSVLAVAVAAWLVYAGGYATVRDSPLHRTDRPRPFVDFLLATFALAVVAGAVRGLGPALGAVDSRVYAALALLGAYLLAYGGVLDRLGRVVAGLRD